MIIKSYYVYQVVLNICFIILIKMGNKQKKPEMTLQDYLIQMRIHGKKLARDAEKANKESIAYMKKAKQAMKRNNEAGAKLYLQSAAKKRNQSMNLMRMGVKMEFIGTNMKSMDSNQKVIESFKQMAKIAEHNNPNFLSMSNNIASFQKCMDQIMINGKMMEEVMTQNTTTNQVADNMLQVLKGQLAMETTNQVNQAALIRQRELQFQENLKKL